MERVKYWIERLALKKHPEGGYYREVYRAGEEIQKSALPQRYSGARNFCTSIYFLLAAPEVSKFHKIKSDETWHFYTGDTVEILVLSDKGLVDTYKLGSDIHYDEYFQHTIPANHWFGAKLAKNKGYALVGCTVAPGFHFDDFELANQEELLRRYPDQRDTIRMFT